MHQESYVYILTNKYNTTLYIGVTNNLERRIYEHKSHQSEGFTTEYNIEKLVWYDTFPDIASAIQREKILKRWKRPWKEALINENNPEWKDLSEEW